MNKNLSEPCANLLKITINDNRFSYIFIQQATFSHQFVFFIHNPSQESINQHKRGTIPHNLGGAPRGHSFHRFFPEGEYGHRTVPYKTTTL